MSGYLPTAAVILAAGAFAFAAIKVFRYFFTRSQPRVQPDPFRAQALRRQGWHGGEE